MRASKRAILLGFALAWLPAVGVAQPVFPPNPDFKALAPEDRSTTAAIADLSKEYDIEEETVSPIPDPVWPWSVACFHFNDKMYFWVVKPLGKGWRYLIYPRFARIGVRDFISNLGFFGRFFNNGMQGRFKQSGIEFSRFLINLTLGVAGFWDPSTRLFHMKPRETDFDETLGRWGMGMGFYITWPFYGPSSGRGSLGLLGDNVLNPIVTWWPVTTVNWINNVSLGSTEYDTIVKAAVDPYSAVRNAYIQYRERKVSEE